MWLQGSTYLGVQLPRFLFFLMSLAALLDFLRGAEAVKELPRDALDTFVVLSRATLEKLHNPWRKNDPASQRASPDQ